MFVKLSKKSLGLGAMLVLLSVIAVGCTTPVEPKNYDQFAQCLSAKGLKIYGSEYCGHCKEQKDMFGESWQFVEYVECSDITGFGQSIECQVAGIEAYPTWELSDGEHILGKQSFLKLSEISGCSLE